MRWFSFSFPADDSELHALAHGIDALGADAHAVAVLPYQLLGFCAVAAPRAGCPAAAGSAGHGNDGVIPLAVDAARVRGFFERADRQHALDEAERKMAERLGGVAGLLQGTQHEVGDDAFFRLADNLSNQALIVLRRDAQLAARERHLHATLAAVAVGVGAAGLRGRRDAAMTNDDLALVQVFDAERVAEGRRQPLA